MTTETWSPYPGWEGLYEISDRGRFRSLDRIVTRSNGVPMTVKGGLLKIPQRPYPEVHLNAPGRRERVRIHVAVAQVFIGPGTEGAEVRHLNGDPTDNRVENLAYGTHADNMRDAVAHGTHRNLQKERCPRGHLLVDPNLVAYSARRGWRKCLACNRAHGYLRRKNDPRLDFNRVADRYYLSLGFDPES